jgi:SAM-dependent methyltransferase
MSEKAQDLGRALWRIYHRTERPQPWEGSGNLPWDDPDFSKRMLREHLDESHAAASRNSAERAIQIEWLTEKLGLEPGQWLLDFTCGPGLYATEFARRGNYVTGVDFSPAATEHARKLAADMQVRDHCQILFRDVRQVALEEARFDAALFIYGQLGVFSREEAKRLLQKLAQALKPGGKLCVELLDQQRVDKKKSNWWFTDDQGLWGDAPFLHLGERFWIEEEAVAVERFQTLHLETGRLDEVVLRDQTYDAEEMSAMMRDGGFSTVAVYPAWDGLALYDASEWTVFVATR